MSRPGDGREQGGAPGGADEEPEVEGGLGLTEEFARLEEEIERETGGPAKAHGGGGEPAGGETQEWTLPDEELEPDESPAATGAAADPEAGGGQEPAAGAGAEPNAGTEADAGAEADTGAGPNVDAEPEADAEAAADAEPNAITEADAGAEPDTDAEPEAEPEADAEEAAADAAPGTDEREELAEPAVTPSPVGIHPAVGGGIAEEEIEDRTPALWWRFLTGSILIVAAVATAVSLSSLLLLTDVAAKLQPIPGIKDKLATIDPGEPQTILIVGSDKRSNTPGDPGRSDTTMLLRVDADNDVLSLFSLPRDLKVDIPGYGVAKLNEAYSAGGVKKTLQTVKDLTGLDVNHVVNVDFKGFADAVDAIGCVYVDVDRRYFNDNSTAATAAEQYATIHVNAGYQRLCGLNALDYVRYRHTDNDFVRAARQQDFLRAARQQVPVGEVLPIISGGDLGSRLIDIFTEYTSSDIKEPAEMIGVLKAFLGVRDVPVKEVHFQAHDAMENGVAYVLADQSSIDKAVREFLGERDTPGPRGGRDANAKRKKGKGGGGSGGGSSKKNADPTKGATVIPADEVYARFGGTSARRLNFPVYVPTQVVPGSAYDAKASRQYEIKDPNGKMRPAYKLVISRTTSTTVTEYYGVMGTSWSDPPILKDPSEERTIGGRTYELFYDGDRLRLVAWQDRRGNSYWVSNTLLQSLSEADMLAIATSMNEAKG